MSDAAREHISTPIAVLMSACIAYACVIAAYSYIKTLKQAPNDNVPDGCKPPIKAMCACAAVALASRLLLYAVSYIFALGGDIEPQLNEMWVRWDASNYLYIAEHGYTDVGDQAYYIVFFPLYSFIVRIVMLVIKDAFAASLIVSNACFCGAAALLYLYAYTRGGRVSAMYAVCWLLAWPTSFFNAAPMTEALFLLLCIACLLALERRAYIVAGAIGMLCALTRSPGVILALPIALGALRDAMSAKPEGRVSVIRKGVAGVLMVPVGLAAYCLINYWVTGDAFRFLLYQREHWNQRMGFFLDTIRMTVSYMLTLDGNTPYIWIPQLLSMAACTAVLCLSVRRLDPVVAIYFCAMFIISISPTWLLSGARYIMGIAPLYVALGELNAARPARWLPLLGASCVLLLVYLGPYIGFKTVM